ncbi:MAG: response regulator transcription factor [Dehalococcoidia bacterium]|jgi:DNA-binding response OmpR family regulator|nr:response regulator transcription factor [Dehalococcoidia bacterium]
MKQRPHILVVDDEPETLKYVGANLRVRGYDVTTAGDGTEALKLVSEHVLDLILLDLMMPGPDGFQVCDTVRRESNVPIVVLSARGREQDKVRALDLGADDYMTKPFGVDELMARVRAALRRAGGSERAGTVRPYAFGGLRMDFAQRQVTMDGVQVKLTPIEYRLLSQLARNAGRVIAHQSLLQAVWGPEYGNEHDYLWAYVRRLRRKLGDDSENPRYITTESGVGYGMPLPEHING